MPVTAGSGAPPEDASARAGAAAPGAALDESKAGTQTTVASLALVALVLGIAGTVLGITVLWFFAAIPIGLAAVVVGVLALRRPQTERHRTRAVLGTVLGCVALVLGVLGAIFVPPLLHRANVALSNVEQDLTSDIDRIDDSLARDVDRIDTTVSRDLRRLERENKEDLLQFEQAAAAALDKLEQQVAKIEKDLTAQERADITRLEQALRTDLRELEASLRATDTVQHEMVAAIEARVKALEKQLGL